MENNLLHMDLNGKRQFNKLWYSLLPQQISGNRGYQGRRDQVYGFSSGGYTGQWDNGSEDKNGKLAFLHQKELILNKGDTENFLQALELTRDLFSNNLNKQRKLLSSRNNTVASNNNITMNIELPNVQNYNDFVDKLQRDKRFENIVQSMTIGNALGKNSLNKLKFK